MLDRIQELGRDEWPFSSGVRAIPVGQYEVQRRGLAAICLPNFPSDRERAANPKPASYGTSFNCRDEGRTKADATMNFVATCILILLRGIETTTNLIGNAAHACCYAILSSCFELRESPDLVDSMIEGSPDALMADQRWSGWWQKDMNFTAVKLREGKGCS